MRFLKIEQDSASLFTHTFAVFRQDFITLRQCVAQYQFQLLDPSESNPSHTLLWNAMFVQATLDAAQSTSVITYTVKLWQDRKDAEHQAHFDASCNRSEQHLCEAPRRPW